MSNGINRQKFVVSMVVAAIVLGMAGYLLQGQKQPQGSPEPFTKASIGISATSFLPSLVRIAKENGYFQQEGVEVEVKGFPTGKMALNAMFSGEVDLGTVAGPPIALASFERDDFVVLGTIVDSAEHSRGLARKDRNITTLSDLAGKKVATTIGTTAHYFMTTALLTSDVSVSEIEMVNMKPKQMVSAITDGTVDAIFAWEPNISDAQKMLGDNALLFPFKGGYAATFNLVSKIDLLENDRGLIKKLLIALKNAEEFVAENREESIKMISSQINTDKKILDNLWDKYTFRLTLRQSLLLMLEDQAKWLIETKFINKKKIPNCLCWKIKRNGLLKQNL